MRDKVSQDFIAKLVNKDLIYSELMAKIKTA